MYIYFSLRFCAFAWNLDVTVIMKYNTKEVGMSKKIDWYYHRNGWTGCARTQAFLAQHNINVEEKESASRKLQATDAKKLLHGVELVWICKGKKVESYSLQSNSISSNDIVALILGPTGNLRAPTIITGKKLLVGFNEDTFSEVFLSEG